ncbi:hypothetical protein ACNKHO_16120 [Shigella flexneri]
MTGRLQEAEEVKELAGWMCDVLDNINDEAVIERVKGKVASTCAHVTRFTHKRNGDLLTMCSLFMLDAA